MLYKESSHGVQTSQRLLTAKHIMAQPGTTGPRNSSPLSHNYFLRSTGIEGTPLPGSLGQPESQISDQGDTCCISGFTLDHPLSPLDKESASPSQLTSREEGLTEQTGYTSVTTRIMKGGSQYTTQPSPISRGRAAMRRTCHRITRHS